MKSEARSRMSLRSLAGAMGMAVGDVSEDDEILAERLAGMVFDFVRHETRFDITADAQDALCEAVEHWYLGYVDECRRLTREGAEPVGGWEDA